MSDEIVQCASCAAEVPKDSACPWGNPSGSFGYYECKDCCPACNHD